MREGLRSYLIRASVTATITVFVALIGGTPLASANSFHGEITSATAVRTAAKHDPNRGTMSVAARRSIHRGYLVPNQTRYEHRKARLSRLAASGATLTAPVSGTLAPSIVAGRSWQGINNPNAAPPDETSAVGTTRYI
jgi:hypothetical protein